MTTAPVVSLTDELIAELEQLAKNATPGPWSSERDQVGPRSQEDDQSYGMLIPVAYIERFDWPENAEANKAFIASANPATILALLAERVELKRDAERLDFILQKYRKIIVERLPGGRKDFYVEEGFMGEKQYPPTKHLGDWEAGSSLDARLKRAAIDAAIQEAKQ